MNEHEEGYTKNIDDNEHKTIITPQSGNADRGNLKKDDNKKVNNDEEEGLSRPLKILITLIAVAAVTAIFVGIGMSAGWGIAGGALAIFALAYAIDFFWENGFTEGWHKIKEFFGHGEEKEKTQAQALPMQNQSANGSVQEGLVRKQGINVDGSGIGDGDAVNSRAVIEGSGMGSVGDGKISTELPNQTGNSTRLNMGNLQNEGDLTQLQSNNQQQNLRQDGKHSINLNNPAKGIEGENRGTVGGRS